MEYLTTEGITLAVSFATKMALAIAILVFGRWGAKIIQRIMKKTLELKSVDPTVVSFVDSITYILLMVVVILAALSKLGVQTTSFVAIIGAAGLAVGLALQGSLSNFAAGMLMIIFRPIKVGDYIEGAGTAGVVEMIGVFTTQLLSPDNKTIILPNAKLSGDNIINYSDKDSRRIDLVFGVGYGDDIDTVKKVISEVLVADDRVLADPPPTIGVLELADSSVNFAVRPWVNTADYWDVYFALNEAMKKRFDQEGISIPFPQRDVHMTQQ
jgi:small conductance mechanosensitive channel